MSSPKGVQRVPLLDHCDTPTLARPLLYLLKTDGSEQPGRCGQHIEALEVDVFIPTAAAKLDRSLEQSSAQPQRPGGWFDQKPAQLRIPSGTADDRDAADEAPLPFSYPEPVAFGSLVNELS